MSATPSTEATLVGDAADAPVSPLAKTPMSHSLAPLHTNDLIIPRPPLSPTKPARPSLKRSVTSTSQARPVSSKNHVDTRGSLSRPALDTPRSFQQLYDEQAYLVASRTAQEQRSRELMRRLAILEDLLNGQCPEDQGRKSKKQASLLKSKIAGAAEQEKAILGRLGEVFVELQNRERWMQVQTETRVASFAMQSPCIIWEAVASPSSDMMTPMVSTPVASPPSVWIPTMETQLDAKSPEFIPMGHFQFPPHDLQPQPYPTPLDSEDPISPLSKRTNEIPGLRVASRPDSKDDLRNHNLAFEYEIKETPKEDVLVFRKAGAERTQHKRRPSLPCLRCMWPVSERVEAFKEDAGERAPHKMNGNDWADGDKDEEGEEVGFVLLHGSPASVA
ncbi:hypothetical protein ACHAQA_008739 [Verticillium albo-atrum]